MEKTLLMLKSNSSTSNLSTSKNKTNKRVVKLSSLLVMSLLLLLSPVLVAAQAVSGVTGIITDPSGAVVPGVQVVLLDTKTSRELTTTTNEDGVYTFNNVPPGGGFRLTFTGAGFQTTVLNDVQLGIGRTETHNAQLSPGQVSGVVEITSSNEATLNTTDASVGNVINERQIRELPIQFRDNPAALLGLQPGVIGNNVGTGQANRVGSVTGSRADQGNITVDGIDSNDVTTGQAFVTIGNLPIDSVQEFRAVSTNPNASEGRSSGGQIQLATRTGTNDFHGSLREYYRGEKFAANTFFNNRNGVARPALQRHQFGGSISGPLPFFNFGEGGPLFKSGKDRLFFFFDYDGRRDDSETAAARTVPLQHFREGRIGYIRATSTSTGAACPSTARVDTRPDCIGFLSQAEARALDPQGVGVNQALLNFINQRYPQANDLTGGNGINTGLFRFNAPVIVGNNTYTSRVDGNINDNQRAFGRLSLTRNSQTNALELFPGDGDSQILNDKSYQLVGGHTWVINPSITNQATVGISRQLWDFPPAASAAYPNSFTFAVIQSPFAGISYQDRDVLVPTLRDDVTWTTGSHTIQFGASYKPIRQNTTLINDFNFPGVGLGGNLANLNVPTGTPSVRPTELLGSATATSNFDAAFVFALGRMSALSTRYVFDTSGVAQPLGTGRKRNWSYNEYELYAQDNWKIRNDLTLNLGLRWQYYPAPFDKNGFQSGNDVDFDELVSARVANNAAGISGNTAEPLLRYRLIGPENNGRPLYKSDYNNFSPRISFNYNPSFKSGLLGAIFGSDRQTSLRGGYSLVYDRVGGALTFIQDQNSYIFDQLRTTNFGASTNPRVNLQNDPRFTGINSLPVQNTPLPITIPFTPNVNAAGRPTGLETSASNYTVVQDFEIPYSHQWSFGIQRELPGNMLLDVNYVGRRSRKQFALADASQAMNFKDPASGQLMFDALNAVQTQLEAGVATANLTPQPWIENQLTAGIRTLRGPQFNCGSFGLGSNCTQLITNFQRTMVLTGNSADLVQILAQNLLLSPNVGMSAQFAVNSYVTNLGEGQYDGMLVTLRKRFSQGFQFDVNYTWAHAIDNNSSIANVTNGTTSAYICNILDVKSCRGDSDFDIRHIANVNGIWDIPFGRGRAIGGNMPKWLDAAIGGWTLAGIFSARSGLPTTSTTGAFTLGFFQDNPAVLIGDRSAFKADIHEEGTGIQYFADPAAALAALRYPRHGESGSRNIFRSENFWTLDAVLSKKFKMPWAESHVVSFRAEAYNLTNSNFFAPPSTAFNSPGTFGRITAVQSAPRVVQFALRYDF
jgi:hypothetical protein